MASKIDICNMALTHLGEKGNIINLDPPEGSAYAEACAVYYDVSRDYLLGQHDWSFATTRSGIAPIDHITSPWSYCYAQPNDFIRTIALIASDATDENTTLDYTQEIWQGQRIILTNTKDPILRYICRSDDANLHSTAFNISLSYLLASMLAGTVVGGAQSTERTDKCLKMYEYFKTQAIAFDSHSRKVTIEHKVSWIEARG